MSAPTFWDVLGVPVGSDADIVRRAYARKLRVTQPEDDPVGFQALREAYELAQQYERWRQADIDPDPREIEEVNVAHDGDVAILPRPRADDETPSDPVATPVDEAVAKLRRLQDLLIENLQHGSAEQQSLVLAELLEASAEVDLPTLAQFEGWMAHLIAANIPHTDALIASAMAHFGWRPDDILDRRSEAVSAMARRLDEIEAIQSLDWQGHALHAGWRLLIEPPLVPWKMQLKAFSPAIVGQIRQLLHAAQTNFPELGRHFDPASATWWQELLSKPRFSLWSLLLVPLGLAFTALVTQIGRQQGVAGAMLMAGTVPLAVASVISPLAHFWLRRLNDRWQQRDPEMAARRMWITHGWIVASALIPFVAMLCGSSFGAAMALVATCLLIALVMVVDVGEPLEQPVGTQLEIFARIAWRPLLILFLFGFRMNGFQPIAFVAVTLLMTVAMTRGGNAIAWAWARILPRWHQAAALLIATTAMVAAVILSRQIGNSAVYLFGLACLLASLAFITAERVDPDGSALMPAVIWAMIIAAIALTDGASHRSEPKATPAIVTQDNASKIVDEILGRLKPAQIDRGMIADRNPTLNERLMAAERMAASNGTPIEDFARIIGDTIDRAYAEDMRASGYDIQLERWRIHVAKARAMRTKGTDFCIGFLEGTARVPDDMVPPDVKDREAKLFTRTLLESGKRTRLAQKRGDMMIPGAIIEKAAKLGGMSIESVRAGMQQSGTRAQRCDSHIALMEAIVAAPKKQSEPLLAEFTLRN